MGVSSIGKRTIYRATQSLGYEVDGWPQTLVPRLLSSGVLKTSDTVEYIDITSVVEDVCLPSKAICLLGKYYIFNVEENVLEEHDIVDEGIETINAKVSEIMRFENNNYLRQFSFDCVKADDQQAAAYQPISGLNIDSIYQTLKTHNFCNSSDIPKNGDLIFYQGRFWMVEDTRKLFFYTPKEKSVLYMSVKQVKR